MLNSGKNQFGPYSVINCAWNPYWTEDRVNAKPEQGCPTCINARQDQYIVSYALRNRRSTARDIQIHVQRAAQVWLLASTIRNRLNSQYLNARRPVSGPILTRALHVARLNFARIHMNWRLDGWRAVMFSHDFRSHVSTCNRRVRVWRRAGERYADCNIQESDRSRGGSDWSGLGFLPLNVQALWLFQGHLQQLLT